MNTDLKSFEEISIEVSNFLKVNPDSEQRLEYIQELNIMLEKRMELAKALNNISFNPFKNSSYTNANFMKDIDEYIQKRLSEIQNNIKSDMLQVKNTKQNEIKYIDPYNRLNLNNSVYYDSKK